MRGSGKRIAAEPTNLNIARTHGFAQCTRRCVIPAAKEFCPETYLGVPNKLVEVVVEEEGELIRGTVRFVSPDTVPGFAIPVPMLLVPPNGVTLDPTPVPVGLDETPVVENPVGALLDGLPLPTCVPVLLVVKLAVPVELDPEPLPTPVAALAVPADTGPLVPCN